AGMRKPTGRRDGRPRYALLLGLAACLLCCGKADKDGFAAPPTDELPVYDQQAARIFDDSIAPEVFGLQVERASPTRDSLLRERSQASDYIARVKLRTIREERFDDSLRYRIVVQPLGEPIAGDALPPELELTVGRASPSL